MANRVGATEYILEQVEAMLPGSDNRERIRRYLTGLSDRDFKALMERYRAGEDFVRLIVPNLGDDKLTMERLFAVAEKAGHQFFQRLWLTDPVSGETYLTPKPVFIIDLPKRRQAQTLVKKVSIPDDNKHVDELTGQPTGASKGSKISFNELQIMMANGHNRIIEELIKYRGGDEKGYQYLEDQITRTGEGDLDALAPLNTAVKSTETFKILLAGMNLDSTLLKDRT